jgi:hypothetical protein
MACGAIPESFPASTPKPGLVAHVQAADKVVGISEKQYTIPAALARNCRFFSISVPALNRAHSPLPRERPTISSIAARIIRRSVARPQRLRHGSRLHRPALSVRAA